MSPNCNVVEKHNKLQVIQGRGKPGKLQINKGKGAIFLYMHIIRIRISGYMWECDKV